MGLDRRATALFRVALAVDSAAAVLGPGPWPQVAVRTATVVALTLVAVGAWTRAATLATTAGVWALALLGAQVPPALLAWWPLAVCLPWGARWSVDALRRGLRDCDEHSAAELNDRTRPAADTRPLRPAPSFAVAGLLAATAVQLDPIGGAIVGALALGGVAVPPLRRLAFVGAVALAALRGAPLLSATAFLMLTAPDFALLKRAFSWLSAPPTAVYYDSDCGICTLVARVFKRLDGMQRIVWRGDEPDVPLPGDWTRERLEAERQHTLLAWRAGTPVRTRHLAVGGAVAALPFGRLVAWVFWLPGLGALLGHGYDRFAAHRHEVSARMGLGVCGMPQPVTEAAPPPPLPTERGGPVDVLSVVVALGAIAGLWSGRLPGG
jgi:predicted DCC family thiol-disulfide oxidoreductase YuxK